MRTITKVLITSPIVGQDIKRKLIALEVYDNKNTSIYIIKHKAIKTSLILRNNKHVTKLIYTYTNTHAFFKLRYQILV